MSENKSKKRKSNFVIQGSILALAGVLVRLIGIVYRIPLQNGIGDEAMGIYSSAFQVYNIMLLLSSYSLPLAVSKMVSARISLGQYNNSFRVFKGVLAFAFGIGAVAALITYFGADFFAQVVLKESRAIYSIRLLAPAIFILALLGVMRGYFQGQGTMVPTAISQILEQIINAAFSLICGFYLFELGRKADLVKGLNEFADSYGAAGATVGTVLGALVALLFFVVVFLLNYKVLDRQLKKERVKRPESYGEISRILLLTIIPVILSTAVYNISSIIDNSIYGYYMDYVGESENYMTIWGMYTGKYTLLINAPIAMANALASSIIPAITRSVARGNKKDVHQKISLGIRFSMIIAIPSTVGLTVLAAPVLNLLFHTDNTQASKMLIVGSLAVVFSSLSTVTNAVLQGINRMREPVKNAAVSLVIHVVVLAVCLYGLRMGIYGVVLANMLFGLCMCVFNGKSVARYLRYRQEIKKTFLLPALASLIMGAAAYGSNALFLKLSGSSKISVLLAIGIAVVVYGICLLGFKCFSEEELKAAPMGTKLVRLAKKIRLM